MKIKSSQTLVNEALNQIKTLSPAEALEMVNSGKCNLIDIRDIRELEKMGRIENSHHIPRGMLEFWMDPDSPYFKEGKIEKTLKLDNNKLQRPIYFNKSLYIAKDNSIIRLN